MWSLAVTLYEVIVGAKPFQANDLEELKVAVLGRTFGSCAEDTQVLYVYRTSLL